MMSSYLRRVMLVSEVCRSMNELKKWVKLRILTRIVNNVCGRVCVCNEQRVNELEAENERIAEQHSDEVRMLGQTADEKQNQLIEQHHSTLQDLTDRHQQDLRDARQHAEEQLTNLQEVVCYICSDRNVHDLKYRCRYLFIYCFTD